MNSQHYRFFHNASLIGTSALEHADPSMGIRVGQFYPEAGYAAVEPLIQEISRVSDEISHSGGSVEKRAALEQEFEQLREVYRPIVFRAETSSGEVIPTSWIDLFDYSWVPDEAGETDASLREIYLCVDEAATYERFFGYPDDF